MIILILIAGLRWKVGGDSIAYQFKFETLMFPLSEFSKTNFEEIGWEPGYLLLNSISKSELPTKKWTNLLSPYAAILNLLIIS